MEAAGPGGGQGRGTPVKGQGAQDPRKEAGVVTNGWVRTVVHLDTWVNPLTARCLLWGWTEGQGVEWWTQELLNNEK